MDLSARSFVWNLLNLTMNAVSNAATTKGKVNRETSKNGLPQRLLERKGLRGSRNLLQTEEFDVPLFLELQFLSTTTVELLDLKHEESEPVRQLCSCVAEQTNGVVVALAAAKMNILLLVNQDSECELRETSRLYDVEAENIFGPGYLSLQVHVLQRVSVVSEETMQQDNVTEIVASGYDITTGGHRLFLNCLNQYESFETVLSVDLSRSLSAEDASPTPNPSRATPQPSRTPTTAPTVNPSSSPTSRPTSGPTNSSTSSPTTGPPVAVPTNNPSVSPTNAPSLPPTKSPTFPPSYSPSTEWPSGFPSRFPSIIPSLNPTTAPTRYDWNSIPIGVSPPVQASLVPENTDPVVTVERNRLMRATSDPLVIAAIAGATATVVVSCLFAGCIWWRRRRPIPKRRSKPQHALSGQLSKGDPRDMIPGFVELDHDQRSLAETSLGDRTAGRPRPMSAKKPQPTKTIRPAESFDENSLYTTPFSVQRDDVSSYHQSYNGPSVLVSQVIRPQQYDENILLPFSDSATTSSDGVSSFGPSSARISTDGSSSGAKSTGVSPAKGPVDLDTHGTYLPSGKRLIFSGKDLSNERARAQLVSQAIDEGSDTYDMDTWSCDFEDFDRGTEFYEAEARSRSPSHSSRSTTKMKNLSSVLGKNVGNKGTSQAMSQGSEDKSSSSADLLKSLKRTERPKIEKTSLDDPPEAKNNENSWSSWSSRMLQDGGIRRTFDPNEGGEYRSPLSKLLDSVTQVVSPLHSNRSIPAVTPEETQSDVDPPTDTSLSREDDSTLLGLEFRDDASTTSSNSTNSLSASPWLFEKVEESLGPRSVTADMESLSGRSNLSRKSPSNRSRTGNASMASYGSRKSFRSKNSFTTSEISFAPRTLEHDLKRLGDQLAALDNEVISTSSAGLSSITASLAKASISSKSRGGLKVSQKKRIVVVVPPGKLGVILANRHDGKGTVVSEIRESSPLFRMLSPGDKLIAVDNDDVTQMVVSQITSLMASRADRERRLTIITSVAQQYTK